ncbi:DEAD/DEAH box helicase [Nitrospira lenta]|uniref:DEAD/DEAH box helicase n=1 Tax=Nitrospira lenta TaxID=1436998 RepID=A0A330L7Z6_9BACT|nr:DEAD/DEAH box helicase [Nitrospira lenta]SPP65371.1 conserved hypothetical protein [Nitrospira lenta]
MPIEEQTSFTANFRKLLLADLSLQLPGSPLSSSDGYVLTEHEVFALLSHASILAISSAAEDRALAYETTTRLIETLQNSIPAVIACTDIVLSRLGNFPGRKLLRTRYTSTPENPPHVPVLLALERAAREIENSVFAPDGSGVALTDFQFDLFSSLDNSGTVSVSAPTSAGKSFVLGLDLVRRLRKGDRANIVYLVPTRALIREVTLKTRVLLRQAGLEMVPVRTVPFPVDQEKAPHGAVYVLTQERLVSLLHSSRGKAWITRILVDEAQGIQDDARGIILQSAVEMVIRQFPTAEVHFASPLVKNPSYLLSLFGRNEGGRSISETVSPVSQNIILVSEVHRKPTQANFELLADHDRIALGVRDLGFSFRGTIHKRRSKFAQAITRADEATLIYADNPSGTEEVALALIEGLGEPHDVDQEIQQLIEFIRVEVHPDYPLVKTLPHAVAFHYGFMPSIVRAQIEELFRRGKIRIVCCTSTLLQGVNLPARHIVIENPHRGQGKPMTRQAFLNLAGRAGRLVSEFHGNIWCLTPAKWDVPSYQGDKLQDIASSMNEVMSDGGTAIQRLLAGQADPDEIDLAEAALGKLYCDFTMAGKSLAQSEYKTQDNQAMLSETDRRCAAIVVTIPREIIDANRSVRPDRLQALYLHMKSQPDPTVLLPLKPGASGSNQRMEEIILQTQKYLEGTDTESNASYKFYKMLATRWIYNMPLGQIIREHLAHLRKKGDSRSSSVIIRDLLKTLERYIRFRLVKHYMAYTSLLALVLNEAGQTEQAKAVEPFHVYLECGASDRSALNLIALGLSRATALALSSAINLPEEASPEDYLNQLNNFDLEQTGIPGLCIREVRELLGI